MIRYATTVFVRMFTLAVGITLIAAGANAQSAVPSGNELPQFEDYPVTQIFKGTPAAPIIATPQQRRFQTRIREGVSKGRDVWTGSWKDPIKSSGPNFAGRHLVIRWGCGSECLMMAIVDGKTGSVYGPPISGTDSGFFIPMDPLSDREIDFRLGSTLMVLKNGCHEGRKECGVYYFNFKDGNFMLLKRVLVDLTKSEGDR